MLLAPAPSFFRFGAVCGILSGLFIALPGAIEAFTGETTATSFVLGVSPAFATPLLVALHLRQHGEAGRGGAIAYAVNLIGLGLFGGAAFTLNMALFGLDDATLEEVLSGTARAALLGSAVVFAVGTALFGLSMVRTGLCPKVPSWGYAVMLGALALVAPLPDSVFTSLVHVFAGASVTWLSLSLWGWVRSADTAVHRAAAPVR
ncbi:hypothetical protein [Streptomyces sp. P17]|uniref:hypothetical protein n=1 Tax=Streptomyces sp. P17 TaxID=3074716 RepID=UPI0028F3ED44|nr:hypothetical protein [Streptomyces sp. P17]MDT9695300.1 hypothetical protein [Streptomyces sp. P17]